MIEIHSIYGLCRPPDMSLADIERCSIPENIQAVPVAEEETDTPGINKTNGSGGNADNSPSADDDPT